MHPDSYKVMHYLDPRQGVNLYVWNARDGAAPERIAMGKQSFVHINPDCDIFMPNHVPNTGDWVLVPASISGSKPDGVPLDAPQLRQVDATMWAFFEARAIGYEEGYRAGKADADAHWKHSEYGTTYDS